MLSDNTLFGEVDKVQMALDRLRSFEPEEGYYLAFSGGKDSVTIKALANMAGVKYDAHYSLTTVDPPELVQFIKHEHGDVKIDHPKETMWKLIIRKGFPPLRQVRYCCQVLKETGGEGRMVVTGIRQQESFKRSKRRMVEQCQVTTMRKTFLNVIIDWTEADVWEFIKTYSIPYCSLYDEGWKRLGCVLCPNGNQKKQAERWPKIAEGYKRACIRAADKWIADGKPMNGHWTNGEEMYEWWINQSRGKREDMSYCTDDQGVMFE